MNFAPVEGNTVFLEKFIKVQGRDRAEELIALARGTGQGAGELLNPGGQFRGFVLFFGRFLEKRLLLLLQMAKVGRGGLQG